jgi:hypothetical protein
MEKKEQLQTPAPIIQEVDIYNVINFIGRKNKAFQAIFLQDLENILGKDTKEFIEVRKLFLDTFNNYTRTVNKSIFGTDFEDGR